MSNITYIDFEEVLNVYSKTIEHSGGGFLGIRDENAIKSTLDFVQNDVYYPTFLKKLSFLISRFCTGHYFNDGNKRISLTLGVYFLHKNGYYWEATVLMREAEAIIYHLAAGNISIDFFEKWIECFMNRTELSEELKLELAKAINHGTLGIDE